MKTKIGIAALTLCLAGMAQAQDSATGLVEMLTADGSTVTLEFKLKNKAPEPVLQRGSICIAWVEGWNGTIPVTSMGYWFDVNAVGYGCSFIDMFGHKLFDTIE